MKTLILVIFISSFAPVTYASGGEYELGLDRFKASLLGGKAKVVLVSGHNCELKRLSFTWRGQTTEVPAAELFDIRDAELQSVKITSVMLHGMGSDDADDEKINTIYVSLDYGPCVWRERGDEVQSRVRFEFTNGEYCSRSTAVPEKKGNVWHCSYKRIGKEEEKGNDRVSVVNPWSTVPPPPECPNCHTETR
jgi:hypothetical protein